MISPDQRELSPIEKRFCDQQLPQNIKSKSGRTFTVHQGLPKEMYAGQGVVSVPGIPHVFTADDYGLQIAGNNIFEATDVKVLYMHGVFKHGRWMPQESSLQRKGLTVEEIIEAYETQTGEAIDAVFVCDSGGVEPVKFKFAKPKIYMKIGAAHGGVTVNEVNGKITVVMRSPSREEVEFERWKNRGRVRLL